MTKQTYLSVPAELTLFLRDFEFNCEVAILIFLRMQRFIQEPASQILAGSFPGVQAYRTFPDVIVATVVTEQLCLLISVLRARVRPALQIAAHIIIKRLFKVNFPPLAQIADRQNCTAN